MRFNFSLKTVIIVALLTSPPVLLAGAAGASRTTAEDMGRDCAGGQLDLTRSGSLGDLGIWMRRLALEASVAARAADRAGRSAEECRIRTLRRLLENFPAMEMLPPEWGSMQSELYQLQNPSANRITGIARDGTRTTIYCNQGPCTMGSVLRHVRLSGLPEMVPLTLYSAVSEYPGGFDSAFEETNRLMETPEFRNMDENAESAYRVPAYTTILAALMRRRELNENNNGEIFDDVFVNRVTQETTTVITTVDAAETEEQRKIREDRAEADRIIADAYLTGNYEWPARPHVCNAQDSAGMSLCD